MFISKEKIVFVTLIMFLLLHSTSGKCIRYEFNIKQSKNDSYITAVCNHVVILFKKLLPVNSDQEQVQDRNDFSKGLLIAKIWWGYILMLVLILLILWYYRRYEIKRIKHLNTFQNLNSESEVSQEDVDSKRFLDPEKEERFNQCLTGMCDKRFCFFYINGNSIHIEDSLEAAYQPASVDMLLSKINGNKFCEHLCREKERYNYTGNRFNPRDIISYKNNLIGFQSDELQVQPYKPSNELNHSVDSFVFFIHKPIIQLRRKPVSPFDKEFLLRTMKVIDANYSDYRFSVEQLARELNMSVSQINRRLNALTGHTAGRMISSFRLQYASGFLIQKTDSISEVCFSAGYNGLAYFSRAFKKEFGCTPSVYRQLMTKKSISLRK